ncbi:hypothetical protein ACSBR1_036196 [Camellia fascicularis]
MEKQGDWRSHGAQQGRWRLQGDQQEGWIPVLRQKGRQGTWKKEERINVFTVFVDNLPNLMNPKSLFNLFTKFGVVKDVFIPHKRRRVTNTRFGFVSFDCIVAATIAIQKANCLWMDDKALEVKHADFGKEKANDKAVKGLVHTQTKSLNVQGGVGRSEVKPFTDQRSYAEVITEQRSDGENITLKAEEIGNGWLYESVAVRLKAKYANISLKQELQSIGIEDIMVRESGGRDVVITFKSKEDMGLKLKPIKELILD